MNNNFFKKGICLALCLVLSVFALAGCGSSAAPAEQPAATEAPAAEEAAAPAEAATPAEEAASEGLLDSIKAKGKLVVGTEAQYAPYEFKDLDANFVGCDMWLAQQIADAIGVELEVVDMAFDGIIPAVQSGQVDLGIAAFTKTPERAEAPHRKDRQCRPLLHQGSSRGPEGRRTEGHHPVPAHPLRSARQRAVRA